MGQWPHSLLPPASLFSGLHSFPSCRESSAPIDVPVGSWAGVRERTSQRGVFFLSPPAWKPLVCSAAQREERREGRKEGKKDRQTDRPRDHRELPGGRQHSFKTEPGSGGTAESWRSQQRHPRSLAPSWLSSPRLDLAVGEREASGIPACQTPFRNGKVNTLDGVGVAEV